MAIHAVCPHCSSPFVLGDEHAGQSFSCSYCHTQIRLPEPAPQPLPPIDLEQIRRVAGSRPPFILFLLGLGALPKDLEKGPAAAAWSARHLFLTVSILIVIVVFAGTAESAVQFGPFFLLTSALLLLAAYIVSVQIADRQIGHKSTARRRKSNLFSTFIVQPFLLPLADPRAALPALRLYFYSALLAAGTLLMGARAGSFAAILPRAPRPFAASATEPPPAVPRSAPTSPLVFNPDVVLKKLPASPPAPADSPTTLPAPSAAPPSSASSPSPLGTTTTPPPPPADTPPPPATNTPAVSHPATDQPPPPPPAE